MSTMHRSTFVPGQVTIPGQTTGRAAGRWLLLALFAAVLAASAPAAHAQHGKVRGTVTDRETGEPLPGATVMVEGTDRGAAAGIDGDYVIVGVRPGTYNVVASFVGFETVRVEGVRVQSDLTTEIDFTLGEEILTGQEVVVTAERPLIQKDVTATTSVVSGEEIRSLPLENFGDVVGLQAGVVDGHFRGGRAGEVGYWVDGLPVTDVFDGGLAVDIENEMVEEVQVVTGAFNAEYGQAMSGIVNIVTRDGTNDFSGSASGFLGDYASTHNTIFNNVGTVSPTAVRNGELNLSGPVVKDRLWFFTSGRYFRNEGSTHGYDVFGFDDVGIDTSAQVPATDLLFPTGSGDSSLVALSPYEKYAGQFKLTWRLNSNMRVSANVLASQEQFTNGGQGLFYFPDARLDQQSQSYSAYLKWTHTLSARTFYEFGVTNNYNGYRQYLFEDPLDPRYRPGEFFGYREGTEMSGFTIGGTDNNRFRRSTNTMLAKFDLTSQVSHANEMKAGLEVRRHDLKLYDEYTVVVKETGQRFVDSGGNYHRSPFEASAYVQDKVELGGLIINAGVRLDYFDANGVVFRDPTDPNAVFLDLRTARRDANGDIVRDESGRIVPNLDADGNLDYTPDAFFAPTSAKWQVSPRLGVAFPITDGGVIHFSYGHFFQIPNFELLYQNPRFALGTGGSGLVGLIGNADLEPEKTVQGELGLKQQLGAASAVEVTVYYRDIRNLAGTATDPIAIEGSGARYGRLVNSDFGFVRGIVLHYDLRVQDRLNVGADYTYQVAKANASDPAQAYQAAAARSEPEQKIMPTAWDQRHTFNLSLSYRGAADWGFGLVGRFSTGMPYTPARSPKQVGTNVPRIIPINSESKPAKFTADLDVYKDVALGRAGALQVFARVTNLFDRLNEYNVFGDTGRASYTLDRNVDAANFRGDPSVLDRWYTRPGHYSEPRRVTVGLTYRF